MATHINDGQVGEKITAMIVSTATAATPRSKPPRRSWRRVAGDTSVVLEEVCEGWLRFESPARRGTGTNRAIKVRLNFWHPLALRFACIWLAAVPFLGLRVAMRPVLRWRGRRQALRHNAEMLRSRP